MDLHSLKLSLPAYRALIAGAATCYALIFSLLVYGIVWYVGLQSWRQPPAPAARSRPVTVTSGSGSAACAEIAGMGQKLCKAEARVDAAREKFQQRVAARKQRHHQPRGERASRAQNQSAQALIAPPSAPLPAPEVFPQQTDPLNTSIATRE